MCAKDMAKIGQLCLNEGVWEGKQIISASWIKDMTRPRKIEGQMWRGMMYGYLWWITNPEKNIYAAIGNSGNVIYVNPDKNVVVSVASYFKPTIFDRVDFIEEYVLKSLLDG
jgi:CubicO group peptidase (beta-lactamase class C family)